MDLSNALTVPWWVGVAGPPLLYGVLLFALMRRRTPERVLVGAAVLVAVHAGLGVAAGATFAALRHEPFERTLFDALRTFVEVPLLQLTWLPLMILPVRWVLRPPRWARKRRAPVKSGRPAPARPAATATPPVPAAAALTFVDSSAPRSAPAVAASARGIIEGRADVLMIEEVMPGTFSPGGAPAVTVAPAPEPAGTPAPQGARTAKASREASVRVPFERIRSQLPASAFVWSLDAIAAELSDPHHILVPRSVVVPQLGEGAVKVGWEVVADQFPRASLAMGDARIAAALPGGVFLLPLDEVIRQVPSDVFDLPAAAVLAARDIEAFPEPFRRASADDAQVDLEDGAGGGVETTLPDAEAAAGIEMVTVPGMAPAAPAAPVPAPVDRAPFLDVETLEPLPEPPAVAAPTLAERVAAVQSRAEPRPAEPSADPLAREIAFEPADPGSAQPVDAEDPVADPIDTVAPLSAPAADPVGVAATSPVGDTIRMAEPPPAAVHHESASAEPVAPVATPAGEEPLDIVAASRPPKAATPRAPDPAPARFPAAVRSSTHTSVESLLAALEDAEPAEPAAPVAAPVISGSAEPVADPALLAEARRAAAALAPLAAFELAATTAPDGGIITLTAGAWTRDELAATARRLAPLFGEQAGLGVVDQVTLRGSEGGAVVMPLEAGAVPTVLAAAVEQRGALALLEILARRAAGARPNGTPAYAGVVPVRKASVERIAVGPAVMHRLRASAAPLAPLGPLMPSVFSDPAGESRFYVFAPPASDAAAIAGLARALDGATSDKVAVTWLGARLTTGVLSARRLSAPAGESAVLVVWDEGRAPRGRVHQVVERAARGLEG